MASAAGKLAVALVTVQVGAVLFGIAPIAFFPLVDCLAGCLAGVEVDPAFGAAAADADLACILGAVLGVAKTELEPVGGVAVTFAALFRGIDKLLGL